MQQAMMEPVVMDVARAYTLLGVKLRLSEEQDRLPEDRRINPCPTCDEGTLSQAHPARCPECEAEGF